MKKLIAFTVIAVMVLSTLMLTSCGGSSSEDLSDSKYVGSWKCTELALADESEGLGDEWIITLNPDGTGISQGGDEEDGEFTWSLTKDGFKTKGDVKLTFTDDGDKIKAKLLGVDMIFEKQE